MIVQFGVNIRYHTQQNNGKKMGTSPQRPQPNQTPIGQNARGSLNAFVNCRISFQTLVQC